MSDLINQVGEFIESGIHPISVDEARQRAERPSTGPSLATRRGVLVGAGMSALAVVLLVLLVALPSGTPGGPSSAAAAALNKLAALTASLATTIGPGEYAYSSIETQTQVLNGTTPQGTSIHEYLNGTVQTWVNAQGVGRMVITSDPTPQFYTPADKAAWEAEGSPPAIAPSNTLSQVLPISPTAGPTSAQVPLYQVAALPTDSSQLNAALRSGGAGVPSFPTTAGCDSADCRLFADAGNLLLGPDVGLTSQLRAALFDVLATVPSVTEVKATTDRYGNTGTAFTFTEVTPSHQLGTICGSTNQSSLTTIPTLTTTYTIVVNPVTAAVLSTEQSTSPDLVQPPPVACSNVSSGSLAFITPRWSAVTSQGIATSDSSLPSTP